MAPIEEDSPNSTPEYNPYGSVTESSPQTHPQNKILIIFSLLLMIAIGISALLFIQNQSLKNQLTPSTTCEYEGKIYEMGEGFTASDGCNSCSCEPNGEVACTDRACLDEDELTRSDPASDWEVYSNAEYSFKYPNNIYTLCSDKSGYLMLFLSPMSECPEVWDSYPDIGIRVVEPSEHTLIKAPKSTFSQNLNGNTFQENIIEYDNEDGPLEYLGESRVFVIEINGKIYEIAFHGKKHDPQIINQIISTFEFTDQTSISPTRSKTYQDKQYNFTFEYPQDWQVRDELASNSSIPNYKNDVVFLGIAPKTVQEDFLASIRVINSDLQSVIAQQKNIPDGAPNKIISEKQVLFAGNPATEIIITNTTIDESGKQIIFEKDNLIFVIEGWNSEEIVGVQDIFSTFEFINL